MSPPPGEGSETRTYSIVGGLVGMALGLLIYDSVRPGGGPRVLAWAAIAGLTGASLGWMLRMLQRPAAASGAQGAEALPEDPQREGGTTSMRFFALPGAQSTGVLRPMRVASHTAPWAPPDLELKLLIEEYDHDALIAREGGSGEAQDAAACLAELRPLLVEHAPPLKRPPELTLVGYRSEGELDSIGRSPSGWNYSLVDGALGLACSATVTQEWVSLCWRTTATFYEPAETPWIDPGEMLRLVARELPEVLQVGLQARVNLPAGALLIRREPLAAIEVDVVAGSVRNAAAVRPLLTERGSPGEPAGYPLADVVSWFRGAPDGQLSHAFLSALKDEEFRSGLRTLAAPALARASSALAGHHGAGAARALAETILALEDPEERCALIRLLAWLPGSLAVVELQALCRRVLDERSAAVAAGCFADRRSGKIDVAGDPIDSLDFAQARAAMGKRNLIALPLLSTYDAAARLIAPLADIGLRVTRSRKLSGQSQLLLGAYLRPGRGDTEGLLTTTPLPVPCHILHLVGSTAELFAQRISDAGLVLPQQRILADLHAHSPARVHVAALYCAALHLDPGDSVAHLIETWRRGRADVNLRRAVLHALEFSRNAEALGFLRARAADAASDDAAVARGIIDRIGSPTGVIATPAPPLPVPAAGAADSLVSA